MWSTPRDRERAAAKVYAPEQMWLVFATAYVRARNAREAVEKARRGELAEDGKWEPFDENAMEPEPVED